MKGIPLTLAKIGGRASSFVLAASQPIFLGTDKDGMDVLGNGTGGVALVDFAAGNIIGGISDPADIFAGNFDNVQGNVISGNGKYGILIGTGAYGNLIHGNAIGTNISGAFALPNLEYGLLISESSGNTIGGTTRGTGNLISGNEGFGLVIVGLQASGNVVQGNAIGTNINGTAALPNYGTAGLAITNAPNNLIGGTALHAGNLISGNQGYGLVIQGPQASGNVVQRNAIGTDITYAAALPNQGVAGLAIADAPKNLIGGTAGGAGNLISGNSGVGLGIAGIAATGNLVQGNRIGTTITGHCY